MFPGAVFIMDTLVTVLVWATEEFPGAASFFSALKFADTLSFVGARGIAVEHCVEVEFSISKEAMRRAQWIKGFCGCGVW